MAETLDGGQSFRWRRNADEPWQLLGKEMGYPAGMPKTMVLDVSDVIAQGAREFRLESNLELYWDRVCLAAVRETPEVQVHTIGLASAWLRDGGYPREYSDDGRLPATYHYEQRDPTLDYRQMEQGHITRYGRVDELLAEVDDRFVIIGGGVVGINSAKMAVGMGAAVTVLDKSAERLRYLDDVFQGRIELIASNSFNIADAVKTADLLVGGVLIPGAKAPHLVTEEMVKTMKKGSVIVDVAIDQGGCIETIDHVTYHSDPVYERHGVIHYSVGNMPGAVARTSTLALTNVTLPYALDLAEKGFHDACRGDQALGLGVNTFQGRVTCEGVASSLGYDHVPVTQLI